VDTDLDRSERFTRLWVTVQPAVSTFTRAMVPDASLAEDLVQETAITALRRFDDYRPGSDFRAWAIGIARNKALHAKRSFARSPLCFDATLSERVADRVAAMADQLDEERRALRECMGRVEGRGLEVLRLRYEDELKPSAIAEATKLTANNVRVMLSRLRRVLEECIQRRLTAEQGAR
jgi:RNA polymerase sigma-70 factor (ECF subfamily)